MNFNENITLDKYDEDADAHFSAMQSTLSEIDEKFETRMDGKTTGSLVLSIIGTVCWLIAFIVAAVFIGFNVDILLLVVMLFAVLGLVTLMMVDNIMSFSYYGKLTNYRNSVTQLRNRIEIGKNSINSNHKVFWDSKSKGWQLALNAGSSIPEEAINIETTISTMETLKKGLIHSAKNIFYYATVVMITIAGCVALFPLGSDIICGISGESFDDGLLLVFNIVALVIVGIGEILLAKWVWSITDCTVTNITLLVVPLAPIAFLALIALATLLVMLLIVVAGIALVIGAIIIGISCLCGG